MTIKEDLKQILNYLWEDEKRNFEESGKPKKHMFKEIKRIADWIENKECELK